MVAKQAKSSTTRNQKTSYGVGLATPKIITVSLGLATADTATSDFGYHRKGAKRTAFGWFERGWLARVETVRVVLAIDRGRTVAEGDQAAVHTN